MAFSVVATTASRPVPDQIRIGYELRSDSTVIDTGSVTFTLPFDPALTANQRRQRIRDIFRQCVRERVQAMRAADADFEAVRTAVEAGQVVVTEGD